MSEGLDDLLGGLYVAALECRLAARLGARDVANVGSRFPDCLSSGKSPDPGGPPHA